MKIRIAAFFACCVIEVGMFCGCGKQEISGEEYFKYHFADKKEAVECFLSNKEYFDGFSECELQYKMQDKNASMEKYLEFGKSQMEVIGDLLEEMEGDLISNGYTLPKIEEIIFINSTQLEEGGVTAYTHGTQIYCNGAALEEALLSEDEKIRIAGKGLMWHEIFHCLTRSNPKFREDMYHIINFTVVTNDYNLPLSVKEIYISNPDVGHHNSYASFEIDGEKKNCFCAIIATRPFEKKGDHFFDCATTALVPVDGSDSYYLPEDSDNFWEIFGRNTDYVLDPEECMADNFEYAMTYGKSGVKYESPEIIDAILDYVD